MGKFVTSDFFNNNPGPKVTEGLSDLRNNQSAVLELPFSTPPADVTILDDNILPTSAILHVDTEGGASNDELRTITYQLSESETWHDGGVLWLKAKDPARRVTLVNSQTVNGVQTVDGKNIVLSDKYYTTLQLRSGTWYQVKSYKEIALSDSVDDSSSTTAASSKAVKTAYDEAKNKLPLSGGTLTGNLEVNGNISSQKLVLTDVEISRIFSDGVRLITFSGKEGDHGLSMRYSPDYGELYLDGRAIHGKADKSAFADEAQNSYGLKGIDIISGATYALPEYGTWKYAYMVSDPDKFIDFIVGEAAGGTTLSAAGYGETAFMEGLAFRSA